MEVQKTVEITATPEQIWPYMVEPEKILRWYSTFRKFEYTSDPAGGMGVPIYIEEKAAGPLMKMNFIITEWVDNRVLGIRMLPGTGPKSYEQRWSVEPTSTGSRFTLWEKIEFPWGVLGRLLGVIGQRMSTATVRNMLSVLKQLVEAETAPAQAMAS